MLVRGIELLREQQEHLRNAKARRVRLLGSIHPRIAPPEPGRG